MNMSHHAFSSMTQFLITVVIAIIGGAVFDLLHIPVPWLLGPMIAMVIGTNVLNYQQFIWHSSLRNIGLMIVGYTIGLSMTATALQNMAKQIPFMLIMTIILILLGSVIAFIISKISATDYQTTFLASIPGGLSQILILAEETKGINFAIVAVTQIIRIMIIVITMPLVVMLPMFREPGAEQTSDLVLQQHATSVSLFPNLIPFVIVSIVATYIGKKIKLPTRHLLAPIIGTAILLFFIQGPELPPLMINAAQLMIGVHVGLLLRTNDLPGKMRTLTLAVISGTLLVAGSIILSFILTKFQPLSSATSLLSLAPGGQDQMGIIAHEVNADLSIVAGYQFFRTIFIYIAVPPLLHFIFKDRNQNKQRQKKQDTSQ